MFKLDYLIFVFGIITSVGGSDELRSIVLQTDGKILVVGNSDSSFAIARYKVDIGNGIGDSYNASDCLSVFPNPSSNFISIDYFLSQNSSVKITLTDIIGVKKLEIALGAKYVGKNLSELNTETLEKGIYILEVHTDYGHFSRKFIKN